MNTLVKLTSRVARNWKNQISVNKNVNKNIFQVQHNIYKMLYKTPRHYFSSEPVQHEFKAETKKLLDIVAKSMYTDKEVFLRELLSNCSDALEKQRFKSMKEGTEDNTPLEIDIVVNEDKKILEIIDTGIGMSKETMISDLGTIAKSGSEQFRKDMASSESSSNAADNIIGQFGIGFYSSFIVGDRIEVISKQGTVANKWVSDGSGTFEISEVENPGFERGTKIIIHLRNDCVEFCKKQELQRIIQKYSNFITYPIAINGEQQNLVQAIWTKSKSEVTTQEYTNFWEHISKSKMDYQYRLHYSVDAPLSIKSLIYIPKTHSEQYGVSQEEMDIHLYSRKVLIKHKCREIFPNYLRFVKGVVDCEDLPLNISRENYQDSALIAKLSNVMTNRVLKELIDQAKRNPEEYLKWYKDFQFFIKEGLAMDQNNTKQLMKLARYSANYTDDLITLDDYISKSVEGQKKIYYVLSPSRDHAIQSPYLEPFRGTDIPVLIINIHIDEMIFRQIDTHADCKFVNVESDYEEVSRDLKTLVKESEKKDEGENQDIKKENQSSEILTEEEQTPFCLWAKNELSPLISKVQISNRLKDSPAIVVSNLSSGMRQMMMMMDKNNQMGMEANQNLTLEINPKHPILVKLNKVRKYDSSIANTILKQLLDNCMVQSGMQIDQAQYMVRIQKLMQSSLDSTMEKIGANEFISQNYDGSQAQRESASNNDVETEIILDEKGNPRVVEKKQN